MANKKKTYWPSEELRGTWEEAFKDLDKRPGRRARNHFFAFIEGKTDLIRWDDKDFKGDVLRVATFLTDNYDLGVHRYINKLLFARTKEAAAPIIADAIANPDASLSDESTAIRKFNEAKKDPTCGMYLEVCKTVATRLIKREQGILKKKHKHSATTPLDEEEIDVLVADWFADVVINPKLDPDNLSELFKKAVSFAVSNYLRNFFGNPKSKKAQFFRGVERLDKPVGEDGGFSLKDRIVQKPDDPGNKMDAVEFINKLTKAATTLEDGRPKKILLALLGGMGLGDVASDLNIEMETVKSNLDVAVKRLANKNPELIGIIRRDLGIKGRDIQR